MPWVHTNFPIENYILEGVDYFLFGYFREEGGGHMIILSLEDPLWLECLIESIHIIYIGEVGRGGVSQNKVGKFVAASLTVTLMVGLT